MSALPQVSRWSYLTKKYGREYHVPSALLLGDIQVESGGNPQAVSGAGALGLTQFLPGTFREYGPKGGDPFIPANAVKAQAHYLSTLYKEYGNWTAALEAYNGGTPANAGVAGQKYARAVLSASRNYGAVGSGPSSTFSASSGGGGVFSNLWNWIIGNTSHYTPPQQTPTENFIASVYNIEHDTRLVGLVAKIMLFVVIVLLLVFGMYLLFNVNMEMPELGIV